MMVKTTKIQHIREKEKQLNKKRKIKYYEFFELKNIKELKNAKNITPACVSSIDSDKKLKMINTQKKRYKNCLFLKDKYIG